MHWKDEQRQQHEALVEAVGRVEARLTPVAGPRRVQPRLGRRSTLRQQPWMALALRFCVDVDSGTTLAGLLKPVPASYVDGDTVRCVCGESHQHEAVVECDCGRLFLGDDSGIWAAKLPC